MKILKSDLQQAAEKQIITSDQADKLWNYFSDLRPNEGKFTALHIIYYLGGVLVLASMSWFLNSAWRNGEVLMFVSVIFAVLYLLVGNYLWKKQNLIIPGGLLITAAVGLTPVFIFGFQTATGWWAYGVQESYSGFHLYIKGAWIFMEIGTIAAALIALRFYKFSFLTFPLAFSLWYLSMDLAPILYGKDILNFDERLSVSCIFGLITIAASYFVDKKYEEVDFAFWTYLAGLLAFWIGLSLMKNTDEFGAFIYFLINVFLIILSVYLHRRTFMVFGALGVLGYIGHLSWVVFKDSAAFPISLAFIGILLIIVGVKYQQNKQKFEECVEKLFPTFLNKLRPTQR